MAAARDNGKVRRDPRIGSLGLTTRYRRVDTEAWHDGKLHDLSVGGAMLQCARPAVGERLEVRLTRASDNFELDLKVEITRLVARADGETAAGVRFLMLKRDTAKKIAALLNEAHRLEAADLQQHNDERVVVGPRRASSDEDAPPTPAHPDDAAVPALSTLRLHDVSLYDLLELDPACADGALESKCEELIADVARLASEAVGRREERLRILHVSLERMRPLWSDPIKRARYDLRWGYLRAEERMRDGERGAGVHPHMLAGIWFDLYPDSVREADGLVAQAKNDKELLEALRQAVTLDPFCRRKRKQLMQLESPGAREVRVRDAQETPTMRGSLSDLPLRSLLRSVAEDEDDAEIVVRVSGKAIGVVGFTQGDVVTAICGDARGLAALRALTAVREGTFQARYASPREHLRHMRSPAIPLLEQALADLT
jgi:hypothetical protein